MTLRSLFALLLTAAFGVAAEPGDWPTYRGNPARTGNTDGLPGPKKPAVLWVVKSQDHFLAAPVPVKGGVYVAGVGAFNRPTASVLAADTGVAVWSRSAPYFRLASVSSPAAVGNLLFLGDGMHQDAGGILHALTADKGQPLWQHPMPGELVHLEGAPTVAGGKVFMGAGDGGVVCVEAAQATLDGKPVTPAEIADRQAARWRELQTKYEADKKRDPDFAVPPNEDQLLKPSPKLVWQQGVKKWHVDAPVNVAGGVVLVASSFLDKEKSGRRELFALDAATGETKWSFALPLNPWGGASVLGDTVVVTGSSVGYAVGELKGAKGEVVAFDLALGNPKWRKDIPGGVVGCAALTDGVAIVTATDGKVRALSLTDGERRWLYDAKAPLFAPAAVAAGAAYVGDLGGAVHAIDTATGDKLWRLDLAGDPKVKSPGMVYAGAVVHGGRLYVGTVNLEGPSVRLATCFVAVGEK